MDRPVRLRFMVCVVVVALLSVLPGVAFGAVTMTHDLNWGSEGWGNGQFKYPPDVTTDKWGNVYVAGGENGDDRVQMFTAGGVFVKSVGVSNVSPAVVSPRTVATDRWGTIYVGEKGGTLAEAAVRIYNPLLYSENGVFQESSADQIEVPTNLAVALDGTVYLAEKGIFLQRWRHRSLVDVWSPLGIATMGVGVTQEGVVLTTTNLDSGIMHSVITYDAGGAYLSDWGGLGTGDGQFDRPYDVGADPLGNVYVIESEGDRGQVFTPGGSWLTTFGSAGTDDSQFAIPYGLSVGLDRAVYVADTFNHRISKWDVTLPTVKSEVSGANRYLTAIEASKKAYPDGADVAILATGANWPDALGGAALAGVFNGPLLLTTPGALPAEVAEELDRLNVMGVYVLGGTGAVSDAVLNAAKALTPLGAATRLGGANRYETANKIAERVVMELGTDYDGTAFVCTGTAFVCTGTDFADALAAAPIAAANGWPIYLTQPAALTPSTRATMLANNSNHGYIIGGTGAVSATVAADLEVMSPLPVTAFGRYGGIDRYDTAAKVAEVGFDGMGMLWSRPALATGLDFPDALAGGVLQGSDYSVLLLTRGDKLSSYAAAKLSAHKDEIYEIRYLGGTSVLKPAVRTAAQALLW